MRASETLTFCDPDLHAGQDVAADYVVFGAQRDEKTSTIVCEHTFDRRQFAACRAHLANAIEHVMTDSTTHAIVRSERAS